MGLNKLKRHLNLSDFISNADSTKEEVMSRIRSFGTHPFVINENIMIIVQPYTTEETFRIKVIDYRKGYWAEAFMTIDQAFRVYNMLRTLLEGK